MAAAVFTLFTFLVAVWAVVYAKRQVQGAREQLEEARSLRREQAQPYVVAYARTRDEVSPHQLEVVLENLGATGARNVVVTSAPPLVRTDPATGGAEPVALPYLLPFLAPSQRWQTYWDSGPELVASNLPQRFEVTVAYDDSFGDHHQEVFVLDWSVFVPRLFSGERTVHHLGKALEDLAKTMKAWSSKNEVVRVATYDGEDFDRKRAREARSAAHRRAKRGRAHQELVERLLPAEASAVVPDEVTEDASPASEAASGPEPFRSPSSEA
ncbi:hypothetical protein [Quadrisphaera setariae]|uniref:Uncharacterized protein n=1 Tax=Quadrisphaera setariae TaxID=2593304 RepID=A0A5C8ZCD4_9ACTN|nr:hypothetical protein [Quadrisphaera setariae]TXR55765.1 hypothetical protein FMM08_13155 [Quadrisphaera setariae]